MVEECNRGLHEEIETAATEAQAVPVDGVAEFFDDHKFYFYRESMERHCGISAGVKAE